MEKKLVTFHMLKKHWETVRKTSWMCVIENKKNPAFIYKPICLQDDSLFEVQEVDPVQAFGLFAAQKFEVRDSSTPLLQVRIKFKSIDDIKFS